MREGVYGRNDPPEEDTGEPTAEDLNPRNIHPTHPTQRSRDVDAQSANKPDAPIGEPGEGQPRDEDGRDDPDIKS